MPKRRLTGSFVALITPMNQDYSVDFEGFRTLIEFQRENGSSAVLIMGSSGEVSMLSADERHAIVAETMKQKQPGMEMWYGCTGPSTEATIGYVRQAAAEGADGAVIAAPAYICAPNADIVDYFLEVADASPIPLGIYNNPPRVKTDLTADEILRIAEHPNVLVLKESTGRVAQVAQIARAEPELSLMCCCSPNLGLIVPIMSLGGHGTANMTGNIIPREMAVISTPWASYQDAEAFQAAYLRNLPMLHYAYSAINPVPMKSLMAAVGLPAGPLRKPLNALTGTALQQGLDIVRDLGLDKSYGFTLPQTLAAAE
ncbi:MAG: dihydrodipicolinate synthase family protein [Alphaproteobacteria bacterium]|jgi:4-hydroxy-tetrahydrodipicolinate synthase|nr:dihydrodipicolinate synthase family protein [Alphaproteobacteria bacterium]